MTSVASAAAVYQQSDYDVRFDWGAEGAAAISRGAGIVVVVDVLSFTTTLSVAADSGITVFPYRMRDASAAAFAAARQAVLAVGRSEAGQSGVSLSPMSVREAASVDGPLRRSGKLVLPSPNGSAIAKAMAEGGATVIGACLRNAVAVARWIDRNSNGAAVAVVAAGERWPGDVLRPAVEDMWGAGAVIAALKATRRKEASPEAESAAAAYRDVSGRLEAALRASGSGRELIADGYSGEIDVAAEVGSSSSVPVLQGEAFRAV